MTPHGNGVHESTVVLMRHGQSEWNRSRRLAGRSDVALSDLGRKQASAARAVVARLSPGSVVCSPLQRARETAALLGHPSPLIENDLQENDVGQWTGRSIDELIEQHGPAYRRWRNGQASPPGGEDWKDLSDRVEQAILPHVAGGGTVLIVAHGGVIRAAVSRLVGTSLQHMAAVDPASLTVVRGSSTPGGDTQFRLAVYNWTLTLFDENRITSQAAR